jgi:hypothetical protein
VQTCVRWSGAGLVLAGLLILPVIRHPAAAHAWVGWALFTDRSPVEGQAGGAPGDRPASRSRSRAEIR